MNEIITSVVETTNALGPVAQASITAAKTSSKFTKYGLAGLAVAAAAITTATIVHAIKHPQIIVTRSDTDYGDDSNPSNSQPRVIDAEVISDTEEFDDIQTESADAPETADMLDKAFIDTISNDPDGIQSEDERILNAIELNLNTIKAHVTTDAKMGMVSRVVTNHHDYEKMRRVYMSAVDRFAKFIRRVSSENHVTFQASRDLWTIMNDMYRSTNLPAWSVRAMIREGIRVLPEHIQQDAISRMKTWSGMPSVREDENGVPVNVLDYGIAIDEFAKNTDRFHNAISDSDPESIQAE